ncbi:hypothetical protein K439DRAFT_812879 [Ramaria rubella]|nr:hypothetical protein K439DRAFT_812879 [Ramaria rubella]
MILSLNRAYGMVAMLGGMKNAFTEPRLNCMWLIIVEGARRLIICGLMILEMLLLLLAPTSINNFAGPFLLPIEAILVSRLLLELRELEQKNYHAKPPVVVAIPMDADGLLTMTNTLDDAENTSQALSHSSPSYSHMMDVSLNSDNESTH